MDRNRKFNLMGSILIIAIALLSRTKAIGAETPTVEFARLSTAERDLHMLMQIAQFTQSLPGRVELSIGRFDSRSKLASCAEVEVFLPPGTRLWGRTQVGLRCRDGGNGQVLVPIEVKLFDRVLVAASAIPHGSPIRPDDVRVVEMELTREPPGLLTESTTLDDQVATRNIALGMTLRAEFLRSRPVVADGETVKIVYRGDGFLVSTEGKALAAAAAGQTVRVQVDSGRILTGIARDGGRVEVR